MSLIRILPPSELGTLCPVCGFDLGFPAWDGDAPSGAGCPSCGLRFGDDDVPGVQEFTYLEWRRGWIKGHMPWGGFRSDATPIDTPNGWDPVVQLRRVGVHIGDSFTSWEVNHPVESWANRDVFLAQAQAKLDRITRRPIALEALWDGDTSGWLLCLAVVVRHTERGEGARYDARDLRCFQCKEEVQIVKYLGETLAHRYGISFFFPSPDKEEDDCPHWWERDAAKSCVSCGVLVKRSFDDSDLCYRCYLDRERGQRRDKPDRRTTQRGRQRCRE